MCVAVDRRVFFNCQAAVSTGSQPNVRVLVCGNPIHLLRAARSGCGACAAVRHQLQHTSTITDPGFLCVCPSQYQRGAQKWPHRAIAKRPGACLLQKPVSGICSSECPVLDVSRNIKILIRRACIAMTYMCVAETRQPGSRTNWSVVRWASDRNTRAGSSHSFQAGQGKLTARCDDADVVRVSAVDSSLPAAAFLSAEAGHGYPAALHVVVEWQHFGCRPCEFAVEARPGTLVTATWTVGTNRPGGLLWGTVASVCGECGLVLPLLRCTQAPKSLPVCTHHAETRLATPLP